MTREVTHIDISTMPEISRLAKEVARDGRPRVLRADGTDLAVLSPVRSRSRRKGKTVTEADIDAALAASWKGLVDPDRLKRELDQARSDDRPPVEL